MSGAHFTQRDPLHDLTPFTNIARHLILQQHALPVTVFGIGNRYCRHQLTGVRVLRVLKHQPPRTNLDDLPQIHHRHAMADALHHRHVVGNKEKGNPQIPL